LTTDNSKQSEIKVQTPVLRNILQNGEESDLLTMYFDIDFNNWSTWHKLHQERFAKTLKLTEEDLTNRGPHASGKKVER
jgi:hypothetical protein